MSKNSEVTQTGVGDAASVLVDERLLDDACEEYEAVHPVRIRDHGDVVHRPVRINAEVAEHSLALVLSSLEFLVRGDEAALSVRRQPTSLARRHAERQIALHRGEVGRRFRHAPTNTSRPVGVSITVFGLSSITAVDPGVAGGGSGGV